MPAPLRLGLIGCGFFAQNHLHAWKDLEPEGVELVAVCDIDADKAKAAAEPGNRWRRSWPSARPCRCRLAHCAAASAERLKTKKPGRCRAFSCSENADA